jgi:catechol 2,3-dioxygenase-like lactoylglutathione lyase family enzyme
MAGPARAGLFIYANDMDRIAAFYVAVAGMVPLHRAEDLTVLQSPDIQLLIHRIPPAIAAGITITVPPQKREDMALKFFFTVANLAENWQGSGFVVCNAMDPEGNVFQVREPGA